MKVELNYKHIRDMYEGEVFVTEDETAYMVITPTGDVYERANAVELATGATIYFDESEYVKVIKCKFVEM